MRKQHRKTHGKRLQTCTIMQIQKKHATTSKKSETSWKKTIVDSTYNATFSSYICFFDSCFCAVWSVNTRVWDTQPSPAYIFLLRRNLPKRCSVIVEVESFSGTNIETYWNGLNGFEWFWHCLKHVETIFKSCLAHNRSALPSARLSHWGLWSMGHVSAASAHAAQSHSSQCSNMLL